MNGVAFGSFYELLFGRPVTAHVLGGCPIGRDHKTAVVDATLKVHGYDRMHVCDGSIVPANLGVNPALSILALTENAMSRISTKEGHFHVFKFESEWGVEGLVNPSCEDRFSST